jgi:hypothetical protein
MRVIEMSFFEASGIEEWCRSADRALRNAFIEAHRRATITRLDSHLLTRSAAERLLAVNAYSRISVARALCEEIGGKLCSNEHWEHEQPIFFATFIPKDGLVTADTRGIDLRRIEERLRADLDGVSYVGAFEPGYYASLPSSGGGRGCQAICWHPHLLMWGVSADRVVSLLWKLRTSGHYQAVVQELKPVHVEQVANGESPDVVAYLLKPPSHAYRVTRYLWSDQDGEIRLKPDGTPRFYATHRRSESRKGERLRVFHAMKHLSLDELLVAGGEGSVLRARALRKAINQLAYPNN